ncbi:MAG: hypothetical protein KDN19_03655 [Verrucomicrobiae bacterium]|nr:hypothetical protein [Verrucomicrobiae bacterium]
MSDSKNSPDFAVREIEVTAPRVREDLRWSFQEMGGEGCYLLEDPLTGRFYRLGKREHVFVKSLDGRRSIAQIVAQLASTTDDELALDPQEAGSLVRMLIDAGLVVSDDSEHAGRVWDEVNRPREHQQALGKMGQLLFLRLPLGNPDRFFAFLARKIGWIASPGFALIWLLVVAWGTLEIQHEWPRFRAQMAGVFNFGNLWILGLLWIVLKAFHECWHGIVCRRFGGAVPEAGVTLLLFTTPLGYVNASSSIGFPSKWQRIAVSAAGMYGELLIAAIAAIAWTHIDPGPLSAALHQVVVLSSITTVLFNANPLMRFDGYYILSDLLDIPNLYTKGQSMTQWLMRRWVLGLKKAKFPLHPNEPTFLITAYGMAAAIWRVIVIVGLLSAATMLFEGAGLIIALVAGAAMILQGIGGAIRYLKKSATAEGLRPVRLILRISLISGLLVAASLWIKITPTAEAPAVVQDISGGEVRVECPGFLTGIGAAPGDLVKAGDLLARLENVEEVSRLRQLEKEIERSRLKRDIFLKSDQLAAWQAEGEHFAALEANADELRSYTATLELRAPRDGIVLARDLESLEDTWVTPGTLLMSVDAADQGELVILASQEDWERFSEAKEAGHKLEFRPRGRWQTVTATFREMIPRASTDPAHFALIAPGDGPLAVRQKSQQGSKNSRKESNYELVKPRFEIHADLDAFDAGKAFREGEIGIAVARASTRKSLAALVLRQAKDQLQRLVERRTRS